MWRGLDALTLKEEDVNKLIASDSHLGPTNTNNDESQK